LQVEVGKVDDEELPWSFAVKYGDQPPIKCQLQGAKDLPLSKEFLTIAEILSGKVFFLNFYIHHLYIYPFLV
jgi:hypothetical protein